MRRTELIETGSIYAEPGSREWALGLRLELWRLLDSADTDHDALNGFLSVCQEREAWRVLQSSDGEVYRDFAEFCLDRRPHGLGVTREMVGKWCKAFGWAETAQALAGDESVGPLQEHGGDRKSEAATSSFAPKDDRYGETASYLVRRLKRDAPDIAAALARGEYPSARAAGIAAGIVKVPTALDILKRAWGKASERQREAFVEWARKES